MLYKPQEEYQGLVEYSLILVLVSVVVILVVILLGPAVGNIFNNIVKIFSWPTTSSTPCPSDSSLTTSRLGLGLSYSVYSPSNSISNSPVIVITKLIFPLTPTNFS